MRWTQKRVNATWKARTILGLHNVDVQPVTNLIAVMSKQNIV